MITRTNWQRVYSGLETMTTYDMDIFYADLNLVLTLNTNIHIRLFFISTCIWNEIYFYAASPQIFSIKDLSYKTTRYSKWNTRFIERKYIYNFWWFPWQPISRWCRTQWAQNLQKWDTIHIVRHRERNEIMTPVTLLKIYIYSSTSKKCGGTSGGSGYMHVREGSKEPFYSESSNFFVYNYHVN